MNPRNKTVTLYTDNKSTCIEQVKKSLRQAGYNINILPISFMYLKLELTKSAENVYRNN
jgi:DNA-dependent RNA polymerase auxiliary subunit epsilon